MGDHDDGLSVFVSEIFEDADDLLFCRRIQVAGRLIREDEIHVACQGPRDSDSLLFAAGKLIDQTVRLAGDDAEAFQEVVRDVLSVFGQFVVRFRYGQQYVFQSGQIGDQIELLENDGNVVSSVSVQANLIDILPFKEDPAAFRRIQSRHQRKQRGLTRTGRTEDRRKDPGGSAVHNRHRYRNNSGFLILVLQTYGPPSSDSSGSSSDCNA